MQHTVATTTTVAEALTKAERELRHLVGKARRVSRARRQGKKLAMTTAYVSIVSGHGLSALRHAKHMLGMDTIEPRTPNN
jgi:hypothetical protein